jgi:hypothetical protein
MDNSFRLLSAPGLLPVNRRLLLVCGAVTKVEIYKVLIGYSRFLCQIFEVRNRAFIKINGYLALCFAVVGATLLPSDAPHVIYPSKIIRKRSTIPYAV